MDDFSAAFGGVSLADGVSAEAVREAERLVDIAPVRVEAESPDWREVVLPADLALSEDAEEQCLRELAVEAGRLGRLADVGRRRLTMHERVQMAQVSTRRANVLGSLADRLRERRASRGGGQLELIATMMRVFVAALAQQGVPPEQQELLLQGVAKEIANQQRKKLIPEA